MSRIRDVYPGSVFYPSRIRISSIADPNFFHPGSRIWFFPIPDPNFFHPGILIRIKEFKYFNPKIWPGYSSQIQDPGSGSATLVLISVVNSTVQGIEVVPLDYFLKLVLLVGVRPWWAKFSFRLKNMRGDPALDKSKHRPADCFKKRETVPTSHAWSMWVGPDMRSRIIGTDFSFKKWSNSSRK